MSEDFEVLKQQKDAIERRQSIMSAKVIEISNQRKFMELFHLDSVNLCDHWDALPDGTTKPDQRLKIVARNIVLEDGTIIRLPAD